MNGFDATVGLLRVKGSNDPPPGPHLSFFPFNFPLTSLDIFWTCISGFTSHKKVRMVTT